MQPGDVDDDDDADDDEVQIKSGDKSTNKNYHNCITIPTSNGVPWWPLVVASLLGGRQR